ncbi:MAG TPA: lytic transglycosylase domain-containing protein [Thermoanaerobaculia bacterium]|nr:lytic transglycosylase domain-containing protein [Thermoanaerobaculia bacterium]
MAEMQNINRPFQQRFLDGFDRSQLRQEVQKVKPRRLQKLRNKYVTWALGASLAVGGIGAPLIIHDSQEKIEHNNRTPGKQVEQEGAAGAAAQQAAPADSGITSDLRAAQNIASQVADGVGQVAQGVTQGVQAAAKVPVSIAEAAPAAVAQVPQQIADVADSAKASFFAKEVPFGSVIYQEAKKNNIRPELVAAVIQQESKFHPTARSGAGAQGLMQLVPKTGRWMGANNLMNPVQNIAAGTKYLRYLSDRFNGNETNIIAAYNAGEGAVRRFGGIPPYHETQKYVANVRNFQRDFADRVEGHTATQIAQMR